MEEKIRAAYEEMNPTPEQEDRMLAALQEAQAAQGVQADRPTAVADGEAAPANVSKKRGGFKAWKVVAPVAACLAVVAIVVGVGSLSPTASQSATSQQATQSASSSDTAQRKTLDTAAPANDAGAKMVETEAYEADGAMGAAVDGSYIDNQFNTEEYASVQETGFISTRSRPLSTVSADVDTASYCNLRRLVNDGAKLSAVMPQGDTSGNSDKGDQGNAKGEEPSSPRYYDDLYSTLSVVPSGAVRIEEMLNYFNYDYEKPAGNDLFGTHAELSTCPWNPDTQLLVLGFATPYETGAADKGANLVFLIDVSGSMNGEDRLELLKDSFTELLANLDANDRVSIVTYSGREEVVLEGASGDDDAEIMRAIYKLKASGSTNGEAGLKMAYEVAQRNYIEGGVNRIVMASDGDLNVGMTSESDLYDFVDGKRETGIYLSVLGFGAGNYKDTKMETLADHGNGSYHYIDCIDEAKRVLSENLMANLVPFADDVKMQIEFNPAKVKGYRLIGYENRALADEDFRNDAVDAGDVGPNAQFTVAYEIVPADSSFEVAEPDLKYGTSSAADAGSNDWLTCSLRYRAFSDSEMHESSFAVDASDRTSSPSNDWKFAASVIEFGMLARDSEYKGSTTVDSVKALLDGMSLDRDRQGFRDLVEKATTVG